MDADSGVQARAMTAERDLGLIRLVIITFNVAVYALWIPKDQSIVWLAIAVSVGALAYALVVILAEPYRYFRAIRTSLYTAATDSLLIALWITATGGILSPFYPLWAVSLVAVAFRYGARPTLATGLLYAMADVAVLWYTGALPGAAMAATVRAVYIGFVAAMGALLGRQWERSVSDRARLASRLASREAERREQERFQLLSEAAMEAILIHDKGKVLEANQAACRLFGYPRQELIGMHASQIVHPDSWPKVEARLRTPSDDPYEVKVRRQDGEIRLAQLQARDIEFRGVPARVTALRDVTEQREAEQARRLTEEQKKEIERLQEIDRFKTQFINAAAHELNTPLTPLKLQMSVLKRTVKEQPRSLVILERNLNRLATLVQDMLDIARLQSGRLRVTLEPVDMGELVREAVETFDEAAKQKNVTLVAQVPESLPAHGDPTRISQVLHNLLSNAVKFTPSGGEVSVHAARDGPEALVEVEDTGMGLEAEQLDLLFQPFSQVHDEKHAIPGTGLGLYISRRLLERLGGRIWAESEGRGLGARFAFTVPVTPAVLPGGRADGPRPIGEPSAPKGEAGSGQGPGSDAPSET